MPVAVPKVLLISAVTVFGLIGVVGLIKKKAYLREQSTEIVQEVSISQHELPLSPAQSMVEHSMTKPEISEDLPEVDRISQLFALDSSKLPIVETISYTSRVPWLKDRAAWIADYSAHYATSRHFIARSLNRKPDYFTQKVSPGDRFNVFRCDKNIRFHLLIDLTRCRMWFYYIDMDTNERVLLKTYHVGLGRSDSKRASGFLTPVGKYDLGNKVAIYQSGTEGTFQGKKAEMVRVFGTRWIPFDREVDGCSESAKGFGIHGAPWVQDSATGLLVEDRNTVGRYDSDGCIRLLSEDVEELFAIIITKPTQVELVKDFHEAKLPGVEKSINP